MSSKPSPHLPQLSRQTILAWIHSILPQIPLTTRIQELGKGVIYCRIINYYFPGVILINRIVVTPKMEYENTLNLRITQNAMAQLRINVPIDPIKLSKEKLSDNWTFVTALYRYLTHGHQENYLSHSSKEEKTPFNGHFSHSHSQRISQNHGNLYMPQTPKRPLEQVYSDHSFYPNQSRASLASKDLFPNKSYYNSSKYSVGKLYKEPSQMISSGTSSPNKGKWSVNSHMFQNNLVPIIDRVKQILLKSSHDTEKIRQIKMLLNIPLNEEVVVKVEQDENNPIITISNYERKQENEKENKNGLSESNIETKTELKM